MVPRRTLPWGVCLLLVAVLVFGAFTAGSASAAPPPRPVCAACGDALEQRAEASGLEVTVTNSTVTVTVDEDGTATWVVRNRIREDRAIQRLRANGTLRDTVAEGRYWDPEVRSVTVTDDGVLVARYVDSDFAEDSVGGSLRSGALTESYGYRNLDGLGADRLTVVAPEGMGVAQTVPGASVSANRSRTTLTSFDRGGFVTFVPGDATLGGLLGWLAIADLLFPVVVTNAAVGILFPALVLGALVGVAASTLRTVSRTVRESVPGPARALTYGGAAGIAVSLLLALGGQVGPEVGLLFGVSTVGTGGGVAWSRAGRVRPTYWNVMSAALLGWVTASTLAIGASLLFRGWVSWYGIAPLLALFVLVAVGFALQRGERWRGVLTAVGAALVALAPTVSLTSRFVAFGLSFRLAFALAETLGLAVVGVPFLIVGALLADTTD